MSIVSFSAMALLICVLAITLKNSSIAPLLVAGGALLLFSVIFERYSSAVSFIYSIAEKNSLGEELSLIFKCSAVAVLASVSAGMCKDMGQPSLADKIELFSSVEIIVLTLPYIETVLTNIG